MLREKRKNADGYEVEEDDVGYRNSCNLHLSVRITDVEFAEN